MSSSTTDNIDPESNTKSNPTGEVNEENEVRDSKLLFSIEDTPPWYLCLFLGFQHYITMFGGTIAYPLLLTPKLCVRDTDPARGQIIATTFFCSGLVTVIQSTLGSRLPIVQGATYAFLIPTLALLNLPQWKCPDVDREGFDPITGTNYSENDYVELWQSRIREVQGAIIFGSLFEVAIGVTGIIGVLLRWITPLSIIPTITLIGLTLFKEAANTAGTSWIVSGITIGLLILFSQYLHNGFIVVPNYRKQKGVHLSKLFIFRLFPVLLAIIVIWGGCAILTHFDVFDAHHPARTDLRTKLLTDSPWFRVPYPFQWGLPTVSFYAVLGIIAACIASAIESVGDYYACARLCGAPPPPTHAINRGIWIEGLGCMFAGIWGSGCGLTSYSENVGAIGVTKVGSRRVVQYAGLLMIVLSFFVKFSTLFATIPTPIIGGVFCIMFAIITAVGLSPLQFVDLNSPRNIFVLGFSVFMGLAIPNWLDSHPSAINTGSEGFDQVLTVLLCTGMFVGGLLGFVLDNTIPGSKEERGISKWLEHQQSGKDKNVESNEMKCYDLPFGLTTIIRHIKFAQYLPVSPTYDEGKLLEKINNLTVNKKHKFHPNGKIDNERV